MVIQYRTNIDQNEIPLNCPSGPVQEQWRLAAKREASKCGAENVFLCMQSNDFPLSTDPGMSVSTSLAFWQANTGSRGQSRVGQSQTGLQRQTKAQEFTPVFSTLTSILVTVTKGKSIMIIEYYTKTLKTPKLRLWVHRRLSIGSCSFRSKGRVGNLEEPVNSILKVPN